MPSPIKPSLYAYATAAASFHHAAIVFCTGALPPATHLTLADLAEPTIPGYARYEGTTLYDLFDLISGSGANVMRLRSTEINMVNRGASPVQLTGVALVVWTDAFTPVVMVIVSSPNVWEPGRRLGGRLLVTSMIRDQGT